MPLKITKNRGKSNVNLKIKLRKVDSRDKHGVLLINSAAITHSQIHLQPSQFIHHNNNNDNHNIKERGGEL